MRETKIFTPFTELEIHKIDTLQTAKKKRFYEKSKTVQ